MIVVSSKEGKIYAIYIYSFVHYILLLFKIQEDFSNNFTATTVNISSFIHRRIWGFEAEDQNSD